MDLVERVASGIPRMRDEMKEAGLPEPVFIAGGGFFTVVFKRPKDIKTKDDTANDIVNDTVNGTVNVRVNDTVKVKRTIEGAVFELIKSNEGLSAPEIAETIGKSVRSIMRYLNVLKKAGKVEFRGAPKTGGYYLK